RLAAPTRRTARPARRSPARSSSGGAACGKLATQADKVPATMWSEIVGIYRASKKQRDINWFTEWVARPPAAVVVYALRSTPVTPNQVTFLSALLAAAACAMIVLLPGHGCLVAAALVLAASLVLDCADGPARPRM